MSGYTEGRPTPLTDATSLDQHEGVTHPDLCETYMAWTDYWALREHARQMERDRAELIEALRELLGFCQRRLPTGSMPPQGQRAMDLLARLAPKEPA